MVKTKQAVPALLASIFAISTSFAGDSSSDEKPNGCKGPTLCHHNPMNDGIGLFLDVGFIYEQVRITGGEYAHTSADVTPWQVPEVGSVLRPKFKLDWGFVLGGGYAFEHDNWIVKASFNYLSSTANDCNVCSCDESPYYVPDCIWCHGLLDDSGTVDPAYTVTAPGINFSVDYYMIQVDLARGSYLSRYMSFEPFFGVKSAWLEFTEEACFKDVTGYYNCCAAGTTGGTAASGTYKIVATNYAEFWGVGPQIGFNTTWAMSVGNKACCESTHGLFADFDAALLIGRAKSYTDLQVDGTVQVHMNNDYSMMSPSLRMVLGLYTQRSFHENQQHVTARIGWDNVVYFNQFTKTCYSGICSLSSHENNTFSLTGLIFDVAWSF